MRRREHRHALDVFDALESGELRHAQHRVGHHHRRTKTKQAVAKRLGTARYNGVLMSDHPRPITPVRPAGTPAAQDVEVTTCPRCGESRELAKVKGCIKCLACHFKFDCNGW